MTIDVAATQERPARVLSVRDEGACAKTIRLSVPPDFEFSPGMWVMLQFPDRAEKANAYSISTSPFEHGYIELTFCKVGPLTERLWTLKGGESLLLRGPLGKWFFRDEHERAVLITAGTGMAPYRSMARYVLDKRLQVDLTIVCSAESPEAFLYDEDMKRFVSEGITVVQTTEHITLAVVEKAVGALEGRHYYLCGPKALVETLSRDLASRGVPASMLHYEKWGDYKWD